MVNLQSVKRYLLRHGGGSRFQSKSYLEKSISEKYSGLLLQHGAFFPGSGAKIVKGRRNLCHENAEKLTQSNQAYRRFTGFALSKDGIWRVHSWVASPTGIIETTEPRVLYFGIPIPGVRKAVASRKIKKSEQASPAFQTVRKVPWMWRKSKDGKITYRIAD